MNGTYGTTTALADRPGSKLIDDFLRRELRVGDPRNATEIVTALRKRYVADAARLDQELAGLPIRYEPAGRRACAARGGRYLRLEGRAARPGEPRFGLRRADRVARQPRMGAGDSRLARHARCARSPRAGCRPPGAGSGDARSRVPRRAQARRVRARGPPDRRHEHASQPRLSPPGDRAGRGGERHPNQHG